LYKRVLKMREFFKRPYVIILMIISFLLLVLMIYSAATEGDMDIFQNVLGTVFTPMQKGAATVKDYFAEKLSYFTKYDDLKEENKRLREELNKAYSNEREKLRLEQENTELKKYLNIKDTHTNINGLAYGRIIARDAEDYLSSFTIDKGTLHGVTVNNVVITPDGVIGVVYEVGFNFSKATTILEPGTPIGALVSRTRDAAIIEGDNELKKDGFCKLSLLPSGQSAAEGDFVETSGLGGIFPKGLIIGRVKEVHPEPYGISHYAVVEPTADILNAKDVMIITSFEEILDENTD